MCSSSYHLLHQTPIRLENKGIVTQLSNRLFSPCKLDEFTLFIQGVSGLFYFFFAENPKIYL